MGRGGSGSKSGARSRYLKQRSINEFNVSGPGLFITCPRGRESRAGDEAKDLFERVVEELYPPGELQNLSVATDEEEENEEDAKPDDIEAQMRRELEDLSAASRPAKRLKTDRTPRTTFEIKKTELECLGFLSFPKMYDPVRAVSHVVTALREGKSGYATQYLQRCTPVSNTCGATLGDLQILAKKYLAPEFGADRYRDSASTAGLRFRIEPSFRHHTAPLNRQNVIQLIGSLVKTLDSPPPDLSARDPEPRSRSSSPPAFSGTEIPEWQHKVDLEHAELVVMVSVYKNVAGISVIRGYDGQGKKWNLQALAEEHEKKDAANMGIAKGKEKVGEEEAVPGCKPLDDK